MQTIPIKTRKFLPPKDDLFSVLQESLADIKNGDVLVVSSKVVAIHEERCVPVADASKADLVASEADLSIPRSYWSSPLTVSHHTFIGSAGIDESNANGYYILLPEDPPASAKKIYEFVTETFGVSELGVIVSDSCSQPFRRGALGVALGFWGFQPTNSHIGKEDLFGREMGVEVTNLADSVAVAANIVMGEVSECQPLAIVRGIPEIYFDTEDHKADLFCRYEDDMFRVLYERFLM
jgi:coenzyme F420-0:L-glutamate ligase